MPRDKGKKQPRVIVFTTPTCTYCNQAKRHLRRHRVRFKEVDISRDSAAARDVQRRTGSMGVPVLDIGGKIVRGFDRPRINELLDINERS
jgi:glutaredoxin-like YruB-family protein